MWMIQCREHTGLALEASAAFRIARQVSWEQFDRDLPAETQVPWATLRGAPTPRTSTISTAPDRSPGRNR